MDIVKKVCMLLLIVSVSMAIMEGCDTKRNEIQNERLGYQIEQENELRVKKGVYLENENMEGLTASEVEERIRELAFKVDKPAREPELDEKTWEVRPGEAGKIVDQAGTLEAVMNAPENGHVSLIMRDVQPVKKTEDVKANIVKIAEYTTPLLDRSSSRVNNIEVAADELNYYILQPGEEFSYNGTLGKRTEKKGYEKAPILVKTEDGTKKSMGVGGGICQLSSTLYNAAVKGGLKITERHPHSKNVGYVPKGKDATVVYGSADLKFINNRKFPIMLRVFVGKKAVTVKIFENRNRNG